MEEKSQGIDELLKIKKKKGELTQVKTEQKESSEKPFTDDNKCYVGL